MTATTPAEIAAAAASAARARAPAAHAQPLVASQYTLLAASYVFNDLAIDLYGTIDESGMEVCDVTLAGSPVSLGDLFQASTLAGSFTRHCERLADLAAQEARAETRFEQRRFARAA